MSWRGWLVLTGAVAWAAFAGGAAASAQVEDGLEPCRAAMAADTLAAAGLEQVVQCGHAKKPHTNTRFAKLCFQIVFVDRCPGAKSVVSVVAPLNGDSVIDDQKYETSDDGDGTGDLNEILVVPKSGAVKVDCRGRRALCRRLQESLPVGVLWAPRTVIDSPRRILSPPA